MPPGASRCPLMKLTPRHDQTAYFGFILLYLQYTCSCASYTSPITDLESEYLPSAYSPVHAASRRHAPGALRTLRSRIDEASLITSRYLVRITTHVGFGDSQAVDVACRMQEPMLLQACKHTSKRKDARLPSLRSDQSREGLRDCSPTSLGKHLIAVVVASTCAKSAAARRK